MLTHSGISLAEKERFELSRRLSRPTPLAGAPLRPLEYFSTAVSDRLITDSFIIIQFSFPVVNKFLQINPEKLYKSINVAKGSGNHVDQKI